METDEELFRRARGGDMAAFDSLYARHERRLFGFICRLLGDRADAEEIFHDVFLSAFKAKNVELQESRFAAWLYRIARNACANKVRGRRRGANAVMKLGVEEPPVPSAEDLLREEQRTLAVASAVEQLPQGLAAVFHLRTSGLSYEAIAEALGIPIGTVKSRMHALVQHLRGELDHDL
jgi:RNA polymerase sigma-70 factor (ECF subfamily)